MIKKIIVNTFYAVFVLVFAWISGQLFFEKTTNSLLASAKALVLPEKDLLAEQIKDLRVIFPNDAVSLEPTLNDPVTRQRLNSIYEPLVQPDRDLNMRPSLAVSWGLINSYTWEFKLRPDVKFHDGSDFDVIDVVASLQRANAYSSSQIAGLLTSIKGLEPIDDLTFRISTYEPDPLLLQRLSTVLIIPSELEKEENIPPTGTGSYVISAWEPGNMMTLKKFADYWGKKAKFESVDLISKVDKSERVNSFFKGEGDLLAFVPYDAVEYVEDADFEISSIPSLEVQFLIFNMDSKLLNDLNSRRAVSLAIDQDAIVEAVGGFAKPVNQFVSNGIFGFNPDIDRHEYDLEKAQILTEKTGLTGKTLKFHLSLGLDVLGEHVRTQLSKIGINVIVSYLDGAKLTESLENGDADFYFFGFKSDLGDSADFLDTVVHSEGSFNVGNYSNPEVDKLIDNSLVEMDFGVRLENLKEAMKIIMEDDVIGVPLLEYETLFSVSDKISIDPRIDGFIFFDELTKK
ncbi:MAG: ABC transporter substrate-binding protein [bacterium]|nr:ABC transporter substrate-binding protein [bacterium]